MVEKDMRTVADYQFEEKLKFLRGMCFNNAAVLLSGRKYEKETLTVEMVFDLAEQLFDEAIKRNYLEYGKVKETLAIPVVLTEKEGTKMGAEDDILV